MRGFKLHNLTSDTEENMKCESRKLFSNCKTFFIKLYQKENRNFFGKQWRKRGIKKTIKDFLI